MKTKNVRKKLGEDLYNVINAYYSEANVNYENFLNRIFALKSIIESKGVDFNQVCEEFKNPILPGNDDIQLDENNVPLEETLEIPNNNERLVDLMKEKFWVTADIEKGIYNSFFYKDLFKRNAGLDSFVLEDVSRNGIQILARCNNPSDWNSDKQGLVMGMVQSGKTVSMLNLIAMAMSTGYKLFVLLAGGKESLRIQTQDRVRSAFGLSYSGWNNNRSVYSPTDTNGYSNTASSPLQIFKVNESPQPVIIITVLKEVNNLKKLNLDIKELKDYCAEEGIDFNQKYTTMILDDESDYASLNTSKRNIRGIHEQLVKLRDNLGKSCYVGYTATPQGCFAAEPNSKIGYPTDFLWLLETMKSPNNPKSTLSYTGLYEFFVEYNSEIVKLVSKDAWPHHKKNFRGVSTGIYNPITGQIEKANLNLLEQNYATSIIDGTRAMPKEFIEAIGNFILGCGIRWFRYRNKLGTGQMPTLKEILNDYPYHAMMFNLSLTKTNHTETLKVVEKCFILVRTELKKWTLNKKSLFDELWINQLIKTSNLLSTGNNDIISSKDEIIAFSNLAAEICEKSIGKSFVYKLNSDKEGDVLNYTDVNINKRTKKCAIFVGGNILSRGLTIENLSISVFIRSQSMSLMDSNLQMCRWFGHKKAEIDLLAIYIMESVKNMFSDIAKCDDALRRSIKESIINNSDPKKVLIELWSSNLFAVTSPAKRRNLKGQSHSSISYTGKTVVLKQPFCNGQIAIINQNNKLFHTFIQGMICSDKKIGFHKRGDLYLDVDFDFFVDFLNQLIINRDALYVSPRSYRDYLLDWKEAFKAGYVQNDVPKINIGFLGANSTPVCRQREFSKKPNDRVEAVKYQREMLGSVLGGSQTKSKLFYKGDRFFDKDDKWHKLNINKEINFRENNEGILILFYKINANYILKDKKFGDVILERNDPGYLDVDSVLTLAAVTPVGGPSYQVSTNQLICI